MKPPEIQLPHVMMLANAGSGKTFTLTTRSIALMALGVEPRRIAALTFTKKAAGEFLEKVFLRLAAGGTDEKAADELNKQVEEMIGTSLPEPLTMRRCQRLLGAMVAQLGELGFGTIDGLFAKLARAFPFEAGLPGDFSILDEAGQVALRREVLGSLFQRAAADAEAIAVLTDLVRRQSRKQAERAVFETLETMIGQLHSVFKDTLTSVTWGDAADIWPVNPAPKMTMFEAVDDFRQAVMNASPGLSEEAVEFLDARCDEYRSLVPGQSLTKAGSDFIKSKLASEPKSGVLQFTKKKTGHVPLTAEVETTRKALLRVLWWREVEQILSRSRALHEVLRTFDAIYQGRVRAQGRLAFADVTHLLAARAESGDWVSQVGFRLDGKFDHWLLDEFQDTSRLQWSVLHPLIDEVLQDTAARRSFFYVGDTKQAIYGWRGGDAGLFFSIADYYNRHGELIQRESLPASYRSCRAVIDGVNAVFGGITGEMAESMGWPEATAAMWNQAWVHHTIAKQNESLTGCFVWKRLSAAEEEEAAGDDESADVAPQDLEILALLREVEPWNRGRSCAVLKRDNKSVARLAALLQAEGLPVAVEGQTNPCMDNPLGMAVHAALRFLGSPGDSLSRLVLAGSKLGGGLLSEGEEAFRSRGLKTIVERGFAGLVLDWLGSVNLEEEPFLQERGRQIRSVASLFDAQAGAGQGPLDFALWMEKYRSQESESSGAVRLMTVHQAKGLTFDMCVVSGLDEMLRDRFTGTMQLGGEENNRWGMLWPGKEWTDADPVLCKEREKLLAGAAYEALCTAYVALTRARLGVYLFTNKRKVNSRARTFDKFLELGFGEAAGEEGCCFGISTV